MKSPIAVNESQDAAIAIMQPYLFPHLPYFQLIKSVEKFVLYDDVTYIKKGWVNRNHVLTRSGPTTFTLPIRGASQNKKICEIDIDWNDRWLTKFTATLTQAYQKAPYFDYVFPKVVNLLEARTCNLSGFLALTLEVVCELVSIDTEIIASSRIYSNDHLKGQERIIDICKRENANTYVNAKNGRGLYQASDFAAQGIQLRFLHSYESVYPQHADGFVKNLSILDALMFNSPEAVSRYLERFELIF